MAIVRTLEIPAVLKRRLLHLRVLSGAQEPAEIDVDAVARVEKAIGRTLGDPLLALLANADGVTERFEMRLGNVESHTREQREAGLPPGLLGIGRRPNGLLIGAPALGMLLHLMREDEVSMVPTIAWLDEQISLQIEGLRDDQSDAKARVYHTISEGELAEFEPALVRSDEPKRRVTHPKFGDGEVVRSFDRGEKLEIRFDDGATKTLLARFVTELE